jgi:hypothetical protein
MKGGKDAKRKREGVGSLVLAAMGRRRRAEERSDYFLGAT